MSSTPSTTSTPRPRFSVIVPYFHGVHPPEVIRRAMKCLQDQTYQNFEALVYHRGPIPPEAHPGETPYPIVETHPHENDWGHTIRDMGIRAAKGDYIVFLNADNIIYPNCFEVLEAETKRPSRLVVQNPNGQTQAVDTDNILIFPIIYHDMQRFLQAWVRVPNNSGSYLIMTGNPPIFGQIDCMQLVMKRELWLAEGGWHDKSAASDGVMYPKFCAKYGYRGVGPVLGEHY